MQELLERFLTSRRQRRLKPVRVVGDWEEHFADGRRYFYNNASQKTQWQVPLNWPPEEENGLRASFAAGSEQGARGREGESREVPSLVAWIAMSSRPLKSL